MCSFSQRWKIVIEFDGTNYYGWQKQDKQKLVTVQGLIEEAINKISISDNVILHGAGRLDKGVHAIAHVAHFDIDRDLDEYKMLSSINYHLLGTRIVVTNAIKVDKIFHSRFSAKSRKYYYKILNRLAPPTLEYNHVWHIRIPLDIQKMQEAANYLKGTHDFTSFRSSICEAVSPIKTISLIEFHNKKDEIYMYIHAKSFMHHQVRNIIGTLYLVGIGKISSRDVQEILKARDRKMAGITAPASGLYLEEIVY